ncbi:Cof-type HAD-IIB family hydrolase [Liquorilactobacillus mali]|uniref:Cof-type HAD-IIB family hydrolase n=1 Tax=Liquorilactobacillus mali TaxID=1618 RepID=UPI0023506BF0|nr:Cof-type HAD-IIB family hydrolase [Liquorilactobacillus mali]MDC7953633.1 HAD family hydrolase [Liquorilactobacillus mali]
MTKLIATDMDGTFLRGDMTYDKLQFRNIHERMMAAEIKFVVASGNQYYQLQSFFSDYPDTIYLAENGAYIRTLEKELFVNKFDRIVADQILAKLETISTISLLVCGRLSAYVLTTTNPEQVRNMRNYYHHLEVVKSYDNIDDDILKFAISCPPEKTEEIVEVLRRSLVGLAEPTSSGHGDIDIIQPGINKAAGLKKLGDLLEIDLKQMVAFGDGGNDLEMIREVGLGVAMANAQPKIKTTANAFTSDNETQGVLKFIDKILLEQ